jgi:hypothetical protein
MSEPAVNDENWHKNYEMKVLLFASPKTNENFSSDDVEIEGVKEKSIVFFFSIKSTGRERSLYVDSKSCLFFLS